MLLYLMKEYASNKGGDQKGESRIHSGVINAKERTGDVTETDKKRLAEVRGRLGIQNAEEEATSIEIEEQRLRR